jgi:hypothetical protein
MAEMLANGQSGRRASLGRWLGAVALAGAAAFLVIQLSWDRPSALAQAGAPDRPGATSQSVAAKPGGMFAVAGQVTKDTYGLYVVDPDNSTICVYQWLSDGPKSGKLRLMASRNFTYDRQLDEYNTEPPVREIKGYVEEFRRLSTTSPASQP